MIINLTAENFKKLVAVRIEPDGSPLVVVGGKNGAGKTSVLDAIEAALGGGKRVPADPIRHGASKAQIVVETEELIVTRTFTAKGSKLKVKPKTKGTVLPESQQKTLDGLVGTLSFDPLEFGRMAPDRQSQVLRDVAGIDLDALDKSRNKYEVERRDIGRDKRRAEGALESIPLPRADDADTLSVSEIVTEINAREQRNDDRNSKRALLDSLRSTASGIITETKTVKDKIIELESALVTARETAADLGDGLNKVRSRGAGLAIEVETLPPNEDITGLKAQLADAEGAAKRAMDADRRADLRAEVDGLARDYDALTAKMAEVDQVRADAIAKARYPIEGLEARDDGVYLDGVPWSQASGAEALRASVAIGLALNPKLKVLLVRDASLLDEDSVALIHGMALDAGAQLWLEMVRGDDAGNDGTAVIIEDGEVAS